MVDDLDVEFAVSMPYRLERKGHPEFRQGLVQLSLFGAAGERAVGT
jgi:hypothetical protein